MPHATFVRTRIMWKSSRTRAHCRHLRFQLIVWNIIIYVWLNNQCPTEIMATNDRKKNWKINVHVKHWRETYAIYKFSNSQLTKPLQPSLLTVSSRLNGLRAREEFNENRSILSIFRLFHFTLARVYCWMPLALCSRRSLNQPADYFVCSPNAMHIVSIWISYIAAIQLILASQVRRHSDVMQANKFFMANTVEYWEFAAGESVVNISILSDSKNRKYLLSVEPQLLRKRHSYAFNEKLIISSVVNYLRPNHNNFRVKFIGFVIDTLIVRRRWTHMNEWTCCYTRQWSSNILRSMTINSIPRNNNNLMNSEYSNLRSPNEEKRK